jgi:hypothetical protein
VSPETDARRISFRERGEGADQLQGIDDDAGPEIIGTGIGTTPAAKVGREAEVASAGQLIGRVDRVGTSPVLVWRYVPVTENDDRKWSRTVGSVQAAGDAQPIGGITDMEVGVGIGLGNGTEEFDLAATILAGTEAFDGVGRERVRCR